MRINAKAAIATFACLFVKPVFAQYYTGPVASAMGGAGLGATEVTETHLMNPASLVHGSAVGIAGYFSDGDTDAGNHRNLLGLSLTSNDLQSYLPGALTYLVSRRTYANSQPSTDQFLQFSLGEFVAKHFSIGGSGIYLNQKMQDGSDFVQWNGVLGALYNPTPEIGIGVSYAYFVHPAGNVPLPQRLIPTAGIGGHFLFMDLVRFRLDILQEQEQNPSHGFIGKGGFETKINDYAVLRLGARRDANRNESFFTAGFAFDGPKLKLDYSFEKDVNGSYGALHSVDLRLPF